MDGPGYVYVMQHADLCKIGISYKPEARLKALRNHTPTRVALLGSRDIKPDIDILICRYVQTPRRIETMLHNRYDAKRYYYKPPGWKLGSGIITEWFYLSADDISDIARFLSGEEPRVDMI